MAVNDSVTQNLLPVQAYFNLDGTFNTFIGQNMPFYATVNPIQSGLTITNSTIDSTIIGANSAAAGYFTNITTTTGQVSTSPVSATDIANKLYVDTVSQGLGPKAACAVATTANITLSGLQTIDGYTILAGDRVLVKNQTNSANNGIYIASSGTWSRSTDMDTWAEVSGAYTVVLNGTQSDTSWVCTSTTGTLGTTPITWVQFSSVNTYYAGTGLTLASNTFSITNTGVTSGSYGSSSNTLIANVNAQGQLTSLSATPIAIANTQVSGLGTLSTQNANSVAITGGSINGTTIGASVPSNISGTTITATTQFSGPATGLTGTASSLSIGGNAATATSATTAGSVTNSVTFNNLGSGAASGSTFNGSSALTVSYDTVGAPSTTGTGASGNWGISITGNAATVTNGVYTTGSYSNPSWITSILGSIVSGAVSNATTASNVSGGASGSLVYQTGASTTSTLALGTSGYVLTAGASAPQYVAQSTLSVGSATTATTATNIAGGTAGAIAYQSATGTTGFTSAGTTGQFLQSNGTGTPTWATPVSYASVTDDTTTNSTRYPLFANQTSGNLATEYTSSTKLQYNPSTGIFTATGFSGSGANLTSIPNSALNNSSVTIGSSAVSLGGTLTTIAGLTSVTSTTFVGALTGNASSATTATNATNATNIAITDNTSSSSTWYPTIVSTTTGNLPATTSSTKLSFVPSTGTLSATNINGTHLGTWNGSTIGVAYGGTGTATPSLVAGTNITITGTWPNQTINSTGGGGGGSTYTRTSFTATASQTTFSVTYTAPYIAVYLNGVLLNATDYTATNGTSVVLSVGANAGDIVETIAYSTTSIGTPAGSNTQVQYNSGGSLGASSGFTFTGNDLNIPFGPSGAATSAANIALALSMIA